MKNFEAQVNRLPTELEIKLSGYFNEAAEMPKIMQIPPTIITVNFGNVVFINSTGIGRWVSWLRSEIAAKAPNAVFKLQECPKCIVDQMNMVKGFLPTKVMVQSVFIPYYSPNTDESKSVLFKLSQKYKTREELIAAAVGELVLDSAGNPMERDVDLGQYFRFFIPPTGLPIS